MAGIEKFVTHYVWKQPDTVEQNASASSPGLLSANPQIRQRLINRLTEMVDRRRRLIKYNFKKEDKAALFETSYPETIRRKEQVIQKFTSVQLEELLNNSTKNVAQEVVTCLIPRRGEGILVSLEGHPMR